MIVFLLLAAILLLPLAAVPLLCGRLAEKLWNRFYGRKRP